MQQKLDDCKAKLSLYEAAQVRLMKEIKGIYETNVLLHISLLSAAQIVRDVPSLR